MNEHSRLLNFDFARQNRRANRGYKTSILGAVLIASTLLVLTLTSCASAPIQHPGAINAFDSNAYDALITEQAAIEQAKSNINSFPQFKTQLNNVIAQYNVTMDAYKTYHSVGSGDTVALQNQINSL